MEERIVKGIWIPIEIWEDRSLSWNEKILLSEIDSYTSNEKSCFFSNDYIAEFLGVSTNWASQILTSLIQKKYVEVVSFDGRQRVVRSTVNMTSQSKADFDKTQRQTLRKVKGRVLENSNHTNIVTNIDYYNDVDKSTSCAKAPSASSKSTPHKFSKPSLSEVEAYCQERGNSVDAEAFIAFYESNGWRVGRNPMKDWKAAVRTWERRDDRRPGRQPESVYEHNLREMQKLGLA